MSDVSNPDQGTTVVQTLDGGWFRRERERIAVGRKGMALRLGTTESKVATLEMRKHDVPREWFGVLRALDFRFPEHVDVSAGAPETAKEDATPTAELTAQSEPEKVEAPPPVVVAEIAEIAEIAESGAAESSPSAVEIVAAELIDNSPDTSVISAPTAAEVVTVEVVAAAEPSVSPPVPSDAQTLAGSGPAEPSSTSSLTPFYGHWLRERRREKGIQTREMVRKLATLPADLYTLERHNIRLPLRWIPGLLKLGVLTVDEAKVATRLPPNKQTAMNGLWLRKQRSLHNLSPQEVATKLGVSALDVRLIEARSWPLPVEWFPALKDLFSTRVKSKAAVRKPASKGTDKAAEKTASKAEVNKSASKPASKPVRGSAKPTDKKSAPTPAAPAKPAASAKTAASAKPAAPAKTAAPAKAKGGAKKSVERAQNAATKKAEAKPASPAAKSPAASVEPAITDTIVSYRLLLGEQAGQSAVEVLGQIAADLQLAKSKVSLSYDRLRAAMKILCSR